MKSIEQFVIIDKKAREMEEIIANYQKQFKIFHESQLTKKQTIQQMFQLINDLQEQNKNLRNKLTQFEDKKIELYKDFELLKIYNQETTLKYNDVNQKNKILIQEIQAMNACLEQLQNQFSRQNQQIKEQKQINQQLNSKINELSSNNKHLELSILQQSIQDKASLFYQKENSILVMNTQHEIKQRIEQLQKFFEKTINKKSKDLSRSQTTRRTENNTEIKQKLKVFHNFFNSIRENIGQLILKNKESSSLNREIKLVLIDIYDFLGKHNSYN